MAFSQTTFVLLGLALTFTYSPVLCQTPQPPVAPASIPAASAAVAVPAEAKTASSSAGPDTSTTSTTTTTTTTTPSPTTTTTTATTPSTTSTPATTAPTPPDTTTTKATTTTVAPPTPLDPTTGHWSASDDDHSRVCVVLQMGIQMRIPYLTTNDGMKTAFVNVPVNATANGGCGDAEFVQLSWPLEDEQSRFAVTFEDNSTAGVYSVTQMGARLAVNDKMFPDHASNLTSFSVRVNFSEPISVPQNASYRCISRQTYQLITDDDIDFSGELLLLHSQLQAYRHDNTTKFASPLVCSADHSASSDIVPIAVGIALALLVVVILIAYIIGRRRARQRGYQSV